MKLKNCAPSRLAGAKQPEPECGEDIVGAGGVMLTGLQSVMAAYVAVWAIFFIYQFTISGRLRHLQDEVERLKAAKR